MGFGGPGPGGGHLQRGWKAGTVPEAAAGGAGKVGGDH